MTTVTLPTMPIEKEFEEGVSALLQSGGYYIERNIIERGEQESRNTVTFLYKSQRADSVSYSCSYGWMAGGGSCFDSI